MRLILIAILTLCGLGFFGTKVYSYFADKSEMTPEKLKAERAAKYASENPPKIEKPTLPDQDQAGTFVPSSPVKGVVAPQLTVGHYVFKNRVAPVAPAFLKASDSSVVVETDAASNAWVWMGTPLFTEQIQDLAETFDRPQMEMDLEFVLVLISTDRLKSKGISVFYQERASFLDVLNLSGDAGSLRISSGSWGVTLDYGDSTTGVSLLSQPVVRCLDGDRWKFATDTQVPIPRSEYVDGVLRQVIEYRPIGFGLQGVVRVVGNRVLLEVSQRNGSVTPGTNDRTNDAPVFQDQVLETSLQLAFSEWSVVGGIQVDKEQTRKGLFRDSLQVTSDYLVIFCRPRLSLEAAPRAFPVDRPDELHRLEPVPFDLLPEKGWKDFPDGVPIDLTPVPSK